MGICLYIIEFPQKLQLSSIFWWLNLVRLYSVHKILYPKGRIESYSVMGTVVSPNKILLN